MDRVRSPAYRVRLSSAPVEEARAASEIVGAAAEDRVSSAEEHAIRSEMSGCVQDLMAQLPESYRTVLVLSETEGLKNNEIAEVLGVSLETVKIRLHRARGGSGRSLKQIAASITIRAIRCCATSSAPVAEFRVNTPSVF